MAKRDGGKTRQKSDRVEYEQTMSASDVASYLEGLARGLREGNVALGDGTRGFATAISGDVELTVQGRRGKRRARIDLTIAFRGDNGSSTATGDGASSDGAEAVSQDTPVTTMPDEMSF